MARSPLRLGMFDDGSGWRPVVLGARSAHPIPDAPVDERAMLEIVEHWDRWQSRVRAVETEEPGGIPIDQGRLGPPLMFPGKLLIAGANYGNHLREMTARSPGRSDPPATEPILVSLPTRHAIVGTGTTIVVPPWARNIDWEAELAVVIGTRARNVPASEAMRHVFGYTIVNDVTSRVAHRREDGPFRHDWLSGKGLDGFCPMGPAIVPKEDFALPAALRLTVNGDTMQDAMTDDLIFDVATLVSYASMRCTLDPGDVISTGTPSGVGAGRGIFLRDGDVMVVSIPEIGDLVNDVRFETV